MTVDLDVAARLDGQIEQAVPAEAIEHVAEERQGGRDAGLARAVELDRDLDLRFLGVSFDRSLPHDLPTMAARGREIKLRKRGKKP
jgi:hypothetical protein